MTDGNLCFLSVAEAASLIAAKQISAIELTRDISTASKS